MNKKYYLILSSMAVSILNADTIKEDLKQELIKALESNNRLIFQKSTSNESDLEQLTNNFISSLDCYKLLMKDKLNRQETAFNFERITLNQQVTNLYGELNNSYLKKETEEGEHIDWENAKWLALKIMDGRHQLQERPSALDELKAVIPTELLRKWKTDAFKKAMPPVVTNIEEEQDNGEGIRSFLVWNKEKTYLAKLTIIKERTSFFLDEICETNDNKLINKLLRKL